MTLAYASGLDEAPLKHNVLSYTCVGIFAAPLPGIPRFSPQFFAKLFEDEYRTTVGIADGGLVAQLMGKPPQPLIHFGPAKFQVRHTSIPGAARLFGDLMQEAYTLTSQQMPLISLLGLNTEHEWIKPAFRPAKRWLADNYVSKGLKATTAGAVAEAVNLQFQLLLKQPDRNYNIQLQPREDVEDAVFAAINDHREWNKPVPTRDEIAKLLEESDREINDRVTPIILGGVAE